MPGTIFNTGYVLDIVIVAKVKHLPGSKWQRWDLNPGVQVPTRLPSDKQWFVNQKRYIQGRRNASFSVSCVRPPTCPIWKSYPSHVSQAGSPGRQFGE